MGTHSDRLKLRSIADLLQERFFVPSYQRGYRWTRKQVVALLDDLEKFQQSDPGRKEYYCLQPVVVLRRPDGSWELVDGQQRLTTLYLVMSYLDEIARFLRKDLYSISYATREDSAAFLREPTAEGADAFIDFHHIYQAHKVIEEWFEGRDGSARLKLFSCLTDLDDQGPNVRVIWYELDPDQNPRAAFIRLNVGRIPLTSAELVRALFLKSPGDDESSELVLRQHRIAQEWDLIEKRLHDESFWFFLQSEQQPPPARIEYLFDVFVQARPEYLPDSEDELATFFGFQAWMESEPDDVEKAWRKVRKETAQVLEEWYEDRELYHLVGYLVATTPRSRVKTAGVLVDLLRAREGRTATEFDRHLRGLAWKRFMGRPKTSLPRDPADLEHRLDERIDALHYDRAGANVLVAALLLFNIASVLETPATALRFRFDGFKERTWDIEHIRSSTEYIPGSPVRRKSWLKHAEDFVNSPAARAIDAKEAAALSTAIHEQLERKAPEKEVFDDLFARVRTLSGEGEAREGDNALSNLALLDTGTNRAYKNAIFPVKRRWIIELDRKGTYVPPQTRNVFLKYHSPQADQLLLWSASDQEAYGKAQRETLLRFFGPLVGVAR